MNNFSRFFNILKKYGIKANDVAAAVGISAGNISDWKSGHSMPSANKLALIADYLGCSVDYLLGTTYHFHTFRLTEDNKRDLIMSDADFIDEQSIVHYPVMKNKLYFINIRDRGRLKKIYFLAKAYNSSIMTEKEYCDLFEYFHDGKSLKSGYTLTPVNYLSFRKIYNIYVESIINTNLSKLFSKVF